jgi:hypothetical protein
MSMAATTTMMKELVIVLGDIKGEVEVCQTDTLHDAFNVDSTLAPA